LNASICSSFIWGLSNFHPVVIQVFSLLPFIQIYPHIMIRFFIQKSVKKEKVKHDNLSAFIDLVIFKSCEEKIIWYVAYLNKRFLCEILFSIYYLFRKNNKNNKNIYIYTNNFVLIIRAIQLRKINKWLILVILNKSIILRVCFIKNWLYS